MLFVGIEQATCAKGSTSEVEIARKSQHTAGGRPEMTLSLVWKRYIPF